MAKLDKPQIASGFLLNIATVGMLVAVAWQVPVVANVLQTSYPVQSRAKLIEKGTPRHLKIAAIRLNLAISEGRYDPSSDSWTLSDTKVLHAINTVVPNDSNGTTLIYGHGTQNIFAALGGLQKGDKAEVRSKNGAVFVYRYSSRRDVEPTDTSIFRVKGEPRLVLQTCSGPWDSLRSLYTFQFVKVRHEPAA